MRMSLRIVAATLVLVVGSVGLGACTGSSSDDRLGVVASFYPLAEAAQRVGGDAVSVTNLTAPGVEPHDVELKPSQLGAIADADVVLYLGGGFQPAVEDALADAGGRTVDVSEGLRSLPVPAGETEPSLTADPHVWLDPVLYRRIVDEVDQAFSDARPADQPAFDANAAAFDRELGQL